MSAAATTTEGGLYPPSAFYFKVVFGSGSEGVDSSFQDVSGISFEMSTEEVPEGGENRFVHKLPTAIKQSNLELKRGIASASSPLVAWCKEVMEGDFIAAIVPRTISVYLLNENAEPIRGWTFANAFPIKWEVEGFNSTKNEVAIEKIVFSYTYSNRVM
ncbi:phage tail protein [Cellvibrio sp.]